MATSWKTRTDSSRPSHEERKAIANDLVATANAVIGSADIIHDTTLSCYYRHAGYPQNRNTPLITEYERNRCHEDRDHGAARLTHILSEHLLRVVPRTPGSAHDLFAQTDKGALSRVCASANALRHEAYHLDDAKKYHGQRYRAKAEQQLDKCATHVATLRDALDDITAKMDSSTRNGAYEAVLLTYCRNLLDVIEQCHHHAFEMLPSAPTKPSGRVR